MFRIMGVVVCMIKIVPVVMKMAICPVFKFFMITMVMPVEVDIPFMPIIFRFIMPVVVSMMNFMIMVVVMFVII